MSLTKPLLFVTLGAAGLGASVLGQQSTPTPTPAATSAKVMRVEVTDCDDSQPALPQAVAPVVAQVARPAQAAAWPAAVGGVSGYTLAGGFGDDPRAIALVRKLADADDDARDKLRGELKQMLVKSFDDRLKSQEKQLADLEKQLKKLRETIGKRKEAKAEIIADRVVALEKEVKGLGW